MTVLPCFGLTEGQSVTARQMWDKMVQVSCKLPTFNFSHGTCQPWIYVQFQICNLTVRNTNSATVFFPSLLEIFAKLCLFLTHLGITLLFLCLKDGQFDRQKFNSGPSMPSSPGETLCAAVSASAWVEPHGKCTIAFSLAWSSPKIKFLKGSSYHRYIYNALFPFSC